MGRNVKVQHNHQIGIIGAGPAGLAVGGCLRHAGIDDFVILEAAPELGHSWRNHYDRLHLHTVKQWSHLPHLPFPEDYELYVPRASVVEYLDSYAQNFSLSPQCNVKVESITRDGNMWKVVSGEQQFAFQHVVIATGINRVPHEPEWPGMDSFNGSIIHSRAYKNPKPYIGKKTLVIGMGNTGAEIAFDLSEHNVETHLVVRSPISLVPRDLNGQPVQVTAKRLAKIPFGLGDWLGSQIRKIYFGNLSKFNLPVSKAHPTVQLRETGKTPVIDIGTIAAIKKGKVKVQGSVSGFSNNIVKFQNGDEISFDDVILATGYKSALSEFIPGVEDEFDDHGLPKNVIPSGKFENMYFIGFDNYKLGGILGTIHEDSQIIANHIISKLN